MKGAIISNGYYQSQAYSHQINRIVEEFSLRGITLDIIKNNQAISTTKEYDFDFALFLDKDLYLARLLEQKGIVVFNNSFAIEKCDDKISTTICLSKYDDVFMPKTIIAPLRYKKIKDMAFINQVEEMLGYPMVAKKAKGSLGDGVILIKDRQELEKIEEQLSDTSHLYQAYISDSAGKSIRAYVIGHKVVAGMLLENSNDFRSNANNSVAKKIELNKEYIVTAQNISEYLELDFCAVDFFYGAPMIIEVNSNAYFEKLEEISEHNIARQIADYVISFIKEIRESE